MQNETHSGNRRNSSNNDRARIHATSPVPLLRPTDSADHQRAFSQRPQRTSGDESNGDRRNRAGSYRDTD